MTLRPFGRWIVILSGSFFLFAGPSPMNNPTSSTLNFPRYDDRANAVTVALGSGGTLSVTGYLAGRPEQPAEALWGIAALMGPVASVVALAMAAIIGWLYPLGQAELARVRDDLAARRALEAAAA